MTEKKILPAFLLCTFFGGIGVHRFYVGKTGSGIAMLLLTLSFIGIIISGPWALIDWFMIVTGNFRDRDGVRINQWT